MPTNEERIHYLWGTSDKASVAKLYKMTGDADFLPDLMQVSAELTREVVNFFGKQPQAIAGVTRGGIGVSAGAESAVPGVRSEWIRSGGWAKNGIEHFPPQLSAAENDLMLAGDMVLASGQTLERTLQTLTQMTQDGFEHIAVVAPIITEMGANLILNNLPNAHIFAGYLENVTQWVTFPATDGKVEKKVLFIGDNLGDGGDMTIQSLMSLRISNPEFFNQPLPSIRKLKKLFSRVLQGASSENATNTATTAA